MSKCETCIFSDRCNKYHVATDTGKYAYQNIDLSTRDDVEEICDDFKDKSLFVELPCKVGDTVYYLTSIDTEKEFGVKEIFCGTVQAISYDGKTIWVSVKYTNGLFYYHNSKDFGKTVFLDREEAEKKLKEMG